MSDKEKIELSQADDENTIDFLWRCIKTLTEIFNRTSVQYGTMARRLDALTKQVSDLTQAVGRLEGRLMGDEAD